jgi:outer membrane receptor for ferrienterochelin and colicins
MRHHTVRGVIAALAAGGLPLLAYAQQAGGVQPSAEQPGGQDAGAPDAAAQGAAAPDAQTGVDASIPAGANAGSEQHLQRSEVVGKARRLNEAREGIQTQTGASTYTFDSDAIQAMPGGDNTLLNQVVLQAPEVAQDSFGQYHVRGEHNGLQYRLNGVILPEGISVFGQSLDPRLISKMSLITGALPAEYGLRTAGIIDLTTKSGVIDPGGSIGIYGGSHGTFEPSFNYAGSAGDTNYFVSADYLRNELGIESPDGSSNPLHDESRQYHAFGYVDHLIDADNRIAFALATSTGLFQIPDQRGLTPPLGLDVNGQTFYPSADLNENQRENTQFAILSWQHADGPLNWQTSVTARNSVLAFTPDPVGDLLFDGIAQQADKRNVAFALQSDGAYRLDDRHTLRAGAYLQRDRSTSDTTSLVLPVDAAGAQTSVTPLSVIDDGAKTETMESVYLQDEWLLAPSLTFNYGLRFDHFEAYASGEQLSPRLNMVWRPQDGTTLHAGYARYFSPPPFELVGTETVAKFAGTSAAPAVTAADTPQPERANYFDVGVEQKLGPGLTGGIDTYYKRSHELIDEGQFGAPIILTPFNYEEGKQYGVEFTMNYATRALSAYGNLALQSARGRDINSAQFNFTPDELAYISNHYIDLDHEQRVTASGGLSYLWHGTRASADLLFGSGLRADLALPNGTSIPNGAHLPYYTQVNFGLNHVFEFASSGTLTTRFDIVNVFDKVYEIRNGTGVGVGAPQFGPRRGFFFGVSKSL